MHPGWSVDLSKLKIGRTYGLMMYTKEMRCPSLISKAFHRQRGAFDAYQRTINLMYIYNDGVRATLERALAVSEETASSVRMHAISRVTT